mgnify:CR=1 FL=1
MYNRDLKKTIESKINKGENNTDWELMKTVMTIIENKYFNPNKSKSSHSKSL